MRLTSSGFHTRFDSSTERGHYARIPVRLSTSESSPESLKIRRGNAKAFPELGRLQADVAFVRACFTLVVKDSFDPISNGLFADSEHLSDFFNCVPNGLHLHSSNNPHCGIPPKSSITTDSKFSFA